MIRINGVETGVDYEAELWAISNGIVAFAVAQALAAAYALGKEHTGTLIRQARYPVAIGTALMALLYCGALHVIENELIKPLQEVSGRIDLNVWDKTNMLRRSAILLVNAMLIIALFIPEKTTLKTEKTN